MLSYPCSCDESATEVILKSVQLYTSLCGQLDLSTPRDAFITALCKASLPPHYALTILNTHTSLHRGRCLTAPSLSLSISISVHLSLPSSPLPFFMPELTDMKSFFAIIKQVNSKNVQYFTWLIYIYINFYFRHG